jgi:hypothetical protein
MKQRKVKGEDAITGEKVATKGAGREDRAAADLTCVVVAVVGVFGRGPAAASPDLQPPAGDALLAGDAPPPPSPPETRRRRHPLCLAIFLRCSALALPGCVPPRQRDDFLFPAWCRRMGGVLGREQKQAGHKRMHNFGWAGVLP